MHVIKSTYTCTPISFLLNVKAQVAKCAVWHKNFACSTGILLKLRAIVRQQEPSGKLAGSVFRRGSRPLRMENKYPMTSSRTS